MLSPLLATIVVCCFSGAVDATALPPLRPGDTGKVRNANHIFNAVHSSMRQWGSSFHHNGMSVFLATVPAGTQFYHGTGFETPVRGLEWLAFEPEHAIMFARKMERPKPQSLADAGTQFQPSQMPMAGFVQASTEAAAKADVHVEDDHRGPPPQPPRLEPGWLHTYRTKEATPLLYIDGMSAGKCRKGTLDTQDVLLLNAADESQGRFWERERADRLCKLATERWKGKIKGFIRMEAGFEIIMCSFSDSVDFIRAVKAAPFSHNEGKATPEDTRFDWNQWEWVKFVSARYDGIGGGRVKLHYDRFVTAYTSDLDLFGTDGDLPRLENSSATVLDGIRRDIDKMVQLWNPMNDSKESTNWQSIADMVVERYAMLLKYLVSDSVTTTEGLLAQLELTLRVFIDFEARDTKAEIDRCVTQFNPPTTNLQSSVAARSIWEVTTQICETLFFLFDANIPFSESVEHLQELVRYLDWSAWKRCAGCPFNEVCWIPMWPMGAVGDRDNPQCRNASDVSQRRGYWAEDGSGRGGWP